MYRIVVIIVTLCYVVSGKNIELAGDLPRILTVDKSPYLIISDIFVPVGKVVKIEPGTVLMFKNFTGLHVHGLLEARGSAQKNIVFTSENDNKFNTSARLNPTPYDWNGIYIRKDGVGTELEKIKICYSVKGLISETKFIRITDGLFSENGRSNLTIEGEEKSVIPGMPFSHNLSIKDAVVDGVPVKILMDPDSKKRNVLRYSGLGLLVGGAAAGISFAMEYDKSMEEFTILSDKDTSNTLVRTDAEWKAQQKKKNLQRDVMSGGFIAALLGLLSFTFSFTF